MGIKCTGFDKKRVGGTIKEKRTSIFWNYRLHDGLLALRGDTAILTQNLEKTATTLPCLTFLNVSPQAQNFICEIERRDVLCAAKHFIIRNKPEC